MDDGVTAAQPQGAGDVGGRTFAHAVDQTALQDRRLPLVGRQAQEAVLRRLFGMARHIGALAPCAPCPG